MIMGTSKTWDQPSEYKTGFYMVRNTNSTRHFFDEWVARLEALPEGSPIKNDQIVLNSMKMNFSLDLGHWFTKTVGDCLGPRCASLLDIKRSDRSRYSSNQQNHKSGSPTRCMAVHSIATRRGATAAQKFELLGEAYARFKGNDNSSAFSRNSDGCPILNFGKIASEVSLSNTQPSCVRANKNVRCQ